jgi:hypothetical protein
VINPADLGVTVQVTNTGTKAGAHLHDQRPGRERRPFSRAELTAENW